MNFYVSLFVALKIVATPLLAIRVPVAQWLKQSEQELGRSIVSLILTWSSGNFSLLSWCLNSPSSLIKYAWQVTDFYPLTNTFLLLFFICLFTFFVCKGCNEFCYLFLHFFLLFYHVL